MATPSSLPPSLAPACVYTCPLGDGAPGALCGPFALLRSCSLWGESHSFVAPASTYLPMWSDLHHQLCCDVTWDSSHGCPTGKSNSPNPNHPCPKPALPIALGSGTNLGVISSFSSSLLPPSLINFTHLCPSSPR